MKKQHIFLILLSIVLILGIVFGEIVVKIEPDDVIPKDGSATFIVESADEIRVEIYDLGGNQLSDSGWVSGNSYTQNFTGYRAGSYIYVVHAKIGSNIEVARGFIYIRYQSDDIRLEAGFVTVGTTWKHVSLTKNFNNPVVIVKSVEGCDDPNSAKELCDFVVPRVKNVTSEGFDIMLQPTVPNTSISEEKRVPYIVVEAGRYKVGGFDIEAGTLDTFTLPLLSPRPYAIHLFNPKFNKEPVVITSITTFNGPDPATTRNRREGLSLYIGPIEVPIILNDFRDGFKTIIDEPWWDPWQEHTNEKISYIAITPGVGIIDGYKVYVSNGDHISDKAKKIEFPGFFSAEPVIIADMQRIYGSDWAIMRYAALTKDSVKLMVAETTCSVFGCTNGGAHVQEPVGYILVGEGPAEELIAHFTATPDSGEPPLEVTFDASGSIGDIKKFSWDFGDGSTAIGQVVTHTYENEGDYTVVLTIEDYSGNTATAQKTITVRKKQNLELVAVIKADKEHCFTIPCTINFDGSESTGPIVKYDWNFGDGSEILSGADLKQVSHTFERYGTFIVTLTIYDNANNSDSASVTISIGCESNNDCFGGDGCYEGVCLHPELTINGSDDKLLAYKDRPLETQIIWTITNVGEHAAVITDIIPGGCESLECEIIPPSVSTYTESTSSLAPPKLPTIQNKEGLILFAGTLELTNIYNTPNPFEYGSSTTFVAEGTGISQINVKIFDMSGVLVFESGFVEGSTYTWEGKNNAGENLAVGCYIYQIIVTDGVDTISSDFEWVCIYSPSEDTLTISAYPNPFEQGETIEITASVSSPRQHALMEIYNSADEKVFSSTIDSGVEGTKLFTFKWDGKDTYGTLLNTGSYKVHIKVWNSGYGSQIDVLEGDYMIEMVPSASPVIAVIKAVPESCANVPCTVTFDASQSQGGIVSYQWDFGDGNTASGITVQHTYHVPGTYTVTLTVEDSEGNKDTASTQISVKTPVPPSEGIVIYPYESIKIVENVKNLVPGKYDLNLTVKYTDTHGASNKQVTSWKSITIEVLSLASDKFHVKLELYDQNFCIASDGTLGLTGKAALPKIKLSWEFVGPGEIDIQACDRKPGEDFIYCDAVQFSIELAKKLHMIEELASMEKFNEIEKYKEFEAYLIGDNYSEDFQKDFAYFYAQGFLEAPGWFTSEPSPWASYFADPERLTFEPREITSGLYKVTIDFNFEKDDYVFFEEAKPVAKIKVRFEKIHDVGIDVPYSPFYFLPFDGLVGTLREDEDGKTERKDYGLGFENENEPLILNIVGNAIVDTRAEGGKTIYTTSSTEDLVELNINSRGYVCEIDLENKVIKLYKSQAVPILLGIKSRDNTAEGFYQLYSGDTLLGEDLESLSYWTGIATSPGLACGDFYGNALPISVPDRSAALFDDSCAIREHRVPAFGFRWDNVIDNESLFMKTMFYLPYDQRMSLSNACAGASAIFASPEGISTGPNEPLNLEIGLRIQKIQDILNLVESEYVCIAPQSISTAPEENKYMFFWNEQRLDDLLEDAKARISAEWGFSWENYQCTVH